MADRDYALRIVGGQFDGVRGFYWSDDGEHPPPDRIIVGTCSGEGECGDGRRAACRQYALMMRRANGGDAEPSRVVHPAYWSWQEDYSPSDAERYRLTHVERHESDSEPDEAVYVLAGVTRRDPAMEARERLEQPLTVADILAAKPPEPATALGKAMQKAREMGLHPTSGMERGRELHRRISDHACGSRLISEEEFAKMDEDTRRRIAALRAWAESELPPGRHDQGWRHP